MNDMNLWDRLAATAIELAAARRDVQTERDRADQWRTAGNRYYEIREWLRCYEDTPEGHGAFYREAAVIVFPGSASDGLTRLERAAARLAAARAEMAAAVAAETATALPVGQRIANAVDAAYAHYAASAPAANPIDRQADPS